MKKNNPTGKKNRRAGVPAMTAVTPVKTINQPAGMNSQRSAYLPFILCVVLVIYYWITYMNTEGLYQHDEATHMLDMLSFWDHPLDTLVGLWSRGGYKILYSLSALAGEPAIVFTNILFTCGAAWLAYKIALHYKFRHAWLAIVFFGLQPYIINLSFRCYAEVPTMFFTALLLFFYEKKKYIPAALTVSFLFTLRQEMALFAILLGLFFLVKRKWLSLLLLVWAPLALSILGWMKTGDSMYIVKTVLQGGINDTYQRNGFFYLWLMLPEIAGVIVMILFFTGYASFFKGPPATRRQSFMRFHGVLLLFTIYFLMHCVFTSKSFGFGRSGGLGRFIIVVSPFLAIIALAGFDYLADMSVKMSRRLIYGGIASLVLVIFLLSVKAIMPVVFNGFTTVVLTQENFLFLLLAVFVLLLLLLQKKGKGFVYASLLSVTIFLSATMTVKPLERGPEEQTMKYVTDWYYGSPYAGRTLHTAHILFNYYSLKNGFDESMTAPFDSISVVNMKKGDLFLYENHYAARVVSPALLDSSRISLVKDFQLPGSPFGAYLLEKK